jgi:hypothetical protein
LRVPNSGKTLLFLFLLFFSFLDFSFGQRVGFGIKGGGNLSFFRGEQPLSGMRRLKPGFSFGGYLALKFPKNRKWQFEIDVMYTRRGNGAKYFNTLDGDTTNDLRETHDQITIGYIEIPLLFKYMLNKGGVNRPYFIFGPTYEGIVHASLKDLNTNATVDYRNSIKRDDLGITVGWGIMGFFINHWYHLDIRYFHGFMNLSENLTDQLRMYNDDFRYAKFQTISKYYNSTFAITLGFSLERPNQYFLK